MTPARQAFPTLQFIDNYCQYYRSVFPEVRSFESFKLLLLGLLSDIKRKTLPEIAHYVGAENSQSLHHFITSSPWKSHELQERRLELTLQHVRGRAIYLLVDESGDPKKGNKTDYVARQYIGRLGKIENGIVSVSVWGLIDDTVFPLLLDVFKPKSRLKEGDIYRTKIQIAIQLVKKVVELGFNVKLVLADSLYGESSDFLGCLTRCGLEYVVSIRSNHGVWMPSEQRVRYNRWRKFDRVFSNGKKQERYIREIIFGKKREKRYWELTTDPEKIPENETSYVMTQVKGVKYKEVGNYYGLRTWVEYAYRESKYELGWSDYRLTHYKDIARWWELVYITFLLVVLYCGVMKTKDKERHNNIMTTNQRWHKGGRWKNQLDNLRLVIEPWNSLSKLSSWLRIYKVPELSIGLSRLLEKMNCFPGPLDQSLDLFSSA